MYDRRTEDRLTARMLYLRPGGTVRGGERKEWHELRREEAVDRVLDPAAAFDRLAAGDRQLLLLDLEEQGVWLMMCGALARLPHRRTPTAALSHRAEEEAAAWLRRNLSRWRRLELPTNLIWYNQALAAADTPAAVCHALTDACLRIFGGHHALVFEQPSPEAPLQVVTRQGLPRSIEQHRLPLSQELNAVGAVLARDPRLGPGQSLEPLRVFFDQLGAGLVVHAPVGDDRVVLITERRGDRTISVEEWQILNLLTEQAEGAFRRIRLFEEVRSLSLTDELTGLPNRRHLRLVLGPAFAAAQRGARLTVLLLDLDNFKQVNDRQGHLAGDRLLRRVAGCLARQGRGSDLVVRFGGDEFLVVFPGGGPASASAFVERVRVLLEPAVPFSVGVAEYTAERMRTTDDLIGAADEDLYRAKRARGLVADLGPIDVPIV